MTGIYIYQVFTKQKKCADLSEKLGRGNDVQRFAEASGKKKG